MASSLAFDAVSEVLSWLPAKEVARMQLLCSRCRNDTSNDHFYIVQSHHASSVAGLIVQRSSDGSFEFVLLDSSSGVATDSVDLLRSTSRKIVGCYNGLIFSQTNHRSDDDYATGDLWVHNPARGTVFVLPPPRTGPLRDSPCMGVAVNFTGGLDYELICVRPTEEWGNFMECKLYSTKERAWTELEHIYVGPRNMQLDSLVFCNGILYIAPDCGRYISSEPYIVSYDTQRGSSGVLPMPAEVLLDFEPLIKICNWDEDSLCLIQWSLDASLFKIWRLDSHGKANSWIKIYEAKLVDLEAVYTFTVVNRKMLVVTTEVAIYAYDLESAELRMLGEHQQGCYPMLCSYANTLRPCGRIEGTVVKIPSEEASVRLDLLHKCKAFGSDIFRYLFRSFRM